jgi:hypothetical protein
VLRVSARFRPGEFSVAGDKEWLPVEGKKEDSKEAI